MIPRGLINLGKVLVALLLIGVLGLLFFGLPAEEPKTMVDEPIQKLVLVEPPHSVEYGGKMYLYTVWSVVIGGDKYYIRTNELLGTGNIHIEFSTNDPKKPSEIFLEMDRKCKSLNSSRCVELEILGWDAIARSELLRISN